MRGVSSVSEELVEQIRQLSHEGLSDAEIGRRLGISGHRVRYIRQKYGIEKPEKEPIPDGRILQLYESGMSCNQIARELGIDPSTVRCRLKKLLGTSDLDYRLKSVEAALRMLPRPLAYEIKVRPRRFYGLTIGEVVKALDVLEKLIYGDLDVITDYENVMVLRKLYKMLMKMLERKQYRRKLLEAAPHPPSTDEALQKA